LARKEKLDFGRQEPEILGILKHNHIFTNTLKRNDPLGQEVLSLFPFPTDRDNLETLLQSTGNGDATIPSNTAVTSRFRTWFSCLTSVLVYMGRRSVVHGNIQPSNILHKDGRVFLTGFDSAYVIDWNESPEKAKDLPKQDVYALGCVFLEMLAVLIPRPVNKFRDCCHDDITGECHSYGFVLGRVDTLFSDSPVETRKFFQECVTPMLNRDLGSRPSAQAASSLITQRNPWSKDCAVCNCEGKENRQF